MPAKKKVEEAVVAEEKEVVEPAKEQAPKKTAAKKATTAKKEKEATSEKEVKEKKVTAKKAEKAVEKDAEEKPKKASTAKKAATKKVEVKKDTTIQFWGTGRRKKSIARVRLLQGNGKVTINGVDLKEYFPFGTLSQVAMQPITLLDVANKFDVIAKVQGGGFSGQSGAIRLGIARALVKFDETYKAELKKAGYLTRDARIKERKKYGLRKARRAVQFSK